MNDYLEQIAYKSERAASHRLARLQGLSEADALRITLERNAGLAGLAALVTSRLAALAAEEARRVARTEAGVRANARPGVHPEAGAWRAWFDGSARPNPGRCSIGVVLRGPDGVHIELAQAVGDGDSSDAEYRALIALLETALAHGARALTGFGDSRVVIDDVNGPQLHAAPALAAYRARVHALLADLPDTQLRWIPRHKNRDADALSQRALATPNATDANHLDDAP